MTSTALDVNHHQADTALAIQPGQIAWDKTQLAALAQIGLKDAGDGDRAVFLHQCQRTGLDPFARQIYMISRNEKVREQLANGNWAEKWIKKWTIQTGIEGWRVIRDRAERRRGVRGILSRPVWYDDDGNEHKVWVRPVPPAACELTYTLKDRDGTETPYTSVLQFREYAQYKDGSLVSQWAVKKSHMLEKCTEADVYRKAFPQDFSGIYLDDALPPDSPDVNGTPAGRPRGRVTAGEVIGRAEPVAEDDTQAGRERAVADDDARPGNGNRTRTDPRAAGAASPRGAQPPPPQDQPAGDEDHGTFVVELGSPPPKATSGQLTLLGRALARLGVSDEERASTLDRLAGPDHAEAGPLTRDEAARIQEWLGKCASRADLIELLATGQLPGTDQDQEGDGDA